MHVDLWKNFEIVEQKDRTRITQSGKNYCAMNCAIQGVRLIWKQKIWLAICEFLYCDFPVNQFHLKFLHSISTFCTNFVFRHSKNNFKFLHCLGLIDMLSANQHGEIFSCIFTYTNETFPLGVHRWLERIKLPNCCQGTNFRIKQVGVGAKFPVRKDNKADDSSVSPSSDWAPLDPYFWPSSTCLTPKFLVSHFPADTTRKFLFE